MNQTTMVQSKGNIKCVQANIGKKKTFSVEIRKLNQNKTIKVTGHNLSFCSGCFFIVGPWKNCLYFLELIPYMQNRSNYACSAWFAQWL